MSDSTSRGYDGVGSVTSAQTTLAAGTDAQAFCYDEQNRLTWASSQTAAGPCGAQNTAGSLTSGGAQYTASYAYDALNRLTSSPLGSYTYGDAAHLHAATSVTSSASTYTASYNRAGDLTCRAPSSSGGSGATCAAPVGSQSGAGLGYNNEGELVGWQNTLAGTPTTSAHQAYDGEGRRVATNLAQNGVVSSTTYYVGGGLEELTVSGASSTLTKYESVPGVCNVVVVGSGPSESLSYVTSDGLGSVSEALDGSGHVTAQQLYGPYGGGRYSSGTMPTSKGFTGQYADAASSGLDYYGARYYDPLLGQFTSADPAGDGLNIFAYVRGNPETLTDPTGLFTGGFCVGGSAGLGIGGMVSICSVVGWSPEDGWSAGSTITVGGGAVAGAGVNGNVGLQLTDANSVDDLANGFVYGGITGSIGPFGAYGGGIGGTDPKGRPVHGLDFGWAPGASADSFAGASNTWVLDLNTQIQTDVRAANWVGQQAGRVKAWATQQASRAGVWAAQQLSRGQVWVGQQVSRAKAWAAQQIQRATSWFNQWSRQRWFSEQIGAAQSWAAQQVAAAQSWVSQQTHNWFGW